MRIGVLTAGGDCPGLNAVIRAVVRKAERQFGDTILGFADGYRGLVENDWRELDVDALRGTLTRGGTILGTSRDTPYRLERGIERTKETFAANGMDGLIVIGGDGSLSCARAMLDDGFPVIGVPKTIDNDVGLTERTFGFDTAVAIATEAVDRLRTTAESHDRVMVVEVMGRNVGHIAAWAGLAAGATVTMIPEDPFDIVEVCAAIRRRHERGRHASVVVVAEGARPLDGTLDLGPETFDDYGHVRMGGIGEIVGDEIERRTTFETRVTILGYVQRGGTPTAFDRVLATRFGAGAIDAVHKGAWGQMVALQSDEIVLVPLADAVAEQKPVSEELRTVLREFFA